MFCIAINRSWAKNFIEEAPLAMGDQPSDELIGWDGSGVGNVSRVNISTMMCDYRNCMAYCTRGMKTEYWYSNQK